MPADHLDIAQAPRLVEGKTEMDALVTYLQVLGTMAKLDKPDYRE